MGCNGHVPVRGDPAQGHGQELGAGLIGAAGALERCAPHRDCDPSAQEVDAGRRQARTRVHGDQCGRALGEGVYDALQSATYWAHVSSCYSLG